MLKGTFCQQNEESASLTSRSEHLPIVIMQYQQKLNWGPAVLPSEFIPQDGAMKPGELKGLSHRLRASAAHQVTIFERLL